MGYTTLWKALSPAKLNIAIQTFSLISIFFEGYDQGVMGGVNASPRYVEEVGIGLPNGHVTDEVHQGGIISIYYLGCIFGCFAGGWAADRIGRINGYALRPDDTCEGADHDSLFIGAFFALVGGALQAATQSSDFILVARVVTGIGTGALTGITPVLVSETSTASHRGGFLGYVFIANCKCWTMIQNKLPTYTLADLGISIAYWLSFGLAFINSGYSDIRWRFLLAFQCFPALVLLAGIRILPDSPRYLASVGRYDEAREVLEHVRGRYDAAVEAEFLEIMTVAKESRKSSPLQFAKILIGRSGKPGGNLGRRAWLCIWLQIMASWTGITVSKCKGLQTSSATDFENRP